jgi:hypothetical protein
MCLLLAHAGEVLHGGEVGVHEAVDAVGEAGLLGLVERGGADRAGGDALFPADRG